MVSTNQEPYSEVPRGTLEGIDCGAQLDEKHKKRIFSRLVFPSEVVPSHK